MTAPDTIAAAVISFESHRDLVPELAETRHQLDALAIKEAAISGLRLRIDYLLGRISAAAPGSDKGVLEGLVAAAERQLETVRRWDPCTELVPR